MFSQKRSRGGLSLEQRVARLERIVESLLEHFELDYQDEPGAPPEVVDLVLQGRKIDAIRVYREKTGVGLKEAKDFVESLDL